MKWLNPLHHFSGCSKVGGGFLKKYKVWGFKILMFARIISQRVNRDDTGSTREKMKIEKAMLKLSVSPSDACWVFLAAGYSLTVLLFSCPSPFMSIPLKLVVSIAHCVLPNILLSIQPDSGRIN